MRKRERHLIKDILEKSNLSFSKMKNGPTVVFIGKKQFSVSIENDKIIVRQLKTLFAKKHFFEHN